MSVYAYDICILAHPADAGAAERLAESIRSYHLPRKTVPATPGAGYRKILPDVLGEPFDEAAASKLDSCRQLIVLCSPDAHGFLPIHEKLLYFERMRGRQNIIAVILRGEPLESFPPFFIEEKWVKHIEPDGSIVERKETLEPVASDLRADSRRRANALLRYETVRIVASALGLEPDALEQRHARRAKRRAKAAAAAVCAVLLAVSGTFIYFSTMAKSEGDTATAMTAESMRVIERLVKELPEQFQDDPAAEAYVQQTVSEAMNLLGTDGAAIPAP